MAKLSSLSIALAKPPPVSLSHFTAAIKKSQDKLTLPIPHAGAVQHPVGFAFLPSRK
jgi:hypothetical protein